MSDQEHEEAESESNVESQEESQKCKLSRKRKAYSLEKKLEAIDYTKKYSKNLAAKKFGVDRARVIEWVKQEGRLRQQKKGSKRVAGAGRHLLVTLDCHQY